MGVLAGKKTEKGYSRVIRWWGGYSLVVCHFLRLLSVFNVGYMLYNLEDEERCDGGFSGLEEDDVDCE